MTLRAFDPPLVPGRLVQRYKRFLADVRLADGSVVVAHVPNTGSMASTRDPDSEVGLSVSLNPKRRLAHTLELVRAQGGAWVGVNTARTNDLAAAALAGSFIPELGGYERLRREVRMGERSRVDIVLEASRGACHVEVKNVTYRRGELALFPDAVTERGARHLDELIRIVEGGGRAAMLFVINRGDCRAMAPAADIDPHYAARLEEAHARGVELLAYAFTNDLFGTALVGRLEVCLRG